MKISQIAIQVPSIKRAKEILTKILGAKFILDDSLKMDGQFKGVNLEDVDLDLSFDYEILKDTREFELINSTDKRHWHSESKDGFLSHLGIYCESGAELESACLVLDEMGFRKIQDSLSYDHTTVHSDGSTRSYIDVIYDTHSEIGFNIKFTLKLKDVDNASV